MCSAVRARPARPARTDVTTTIHDDYKVVLGCRASVVGSYLQVSKRACLSGTILSVTNWEPRFRFVFVFLEHAKHSLTPNP
jgi:hypothetical protein